jgi:hypothetical protein
MFGRLFVAVVVLLGAILWLDPSVLPDLALGAFEAVASWIVGAVEGVLGAAEQAIRDTIF